MEVDELLIRRAEELLARAAKKGEQCRTAFLDPGERAVISRDVWDTDGAYKAFIGGADDAERTCLVACPSWDEPDAGFLRLLCGEYDSRYAGLTHRDVLGSVLAQGIERETVGDIYTASDKVYMWVLDTVADYVCSELTKIGRVGVKLRAVDPTTVRLPKPETEPVTVNVTSLRLDSVIAAAYGLSRSESAASIRQGLVKVDHIVTVDCDKQLGEGCLLSYKGKGRMRFERVTGTSKKGRLYLLLAKYK